MYKFSKLITNIYQTKKNTLVQISFYILSFSNIYTKLAGICLSTIGDIKPPHRFIAALIVCERILNHCLKASAMHAKTFWTKSHK